MTVIIQATVRLAEIEVEEAGDRFRGDGPQIAIAITEDGLSIPDPRRVGRSIANSLHSVASSLENHWLGGVVASDDGFEIVVTRGTKASVALVLPGVPVPPEDEEGDRASG